MQNNGIIFTSYEEQIMQDTAFLLAKREVSEKVADLFIMLQHALEERPAALHLPQRMLGISFQGPKISKGENYKGLPYIVLDHPRYFHQQNAFAFRSLFWWGHFYSFSLHLQGAVWERYKDSLNITSLISADTYISTGEGPWEYHFEEDNFRLLTDDNAAALLQAAKEKSFIKLSRKIPLSSKPDAVIAEAVQAYTDFLEALGHRL